MGCCHRCLCGRIGESSGRACPQEPRGREEVFLDYGPRSNAELLTTHGFALPRDPHGTIPLALEPTATDETAPMKRKILAAGNLHAPFLLSPELLRVDSDVLVALRIIAATRPSSSGTRTPSVVSPSLHVTRSSGASCSRPRCCRCSRRPSKSRQSSRTGDSSKLLAPVERVGRVQLTRGPIQPRVHCRAL